MFPVNILPAHNVLIFENHKISIPKNMPFQCYISCDSYQFSSKRNSWSNMLVTFVFCIQVNLCELVHQEIWLCKPTANPHRFIMELSCERDMQGDLRRACVHADLPIDINVVRIYLNHPVWIDSDHRICK